MPDRDRMETAVKDWQYYIGSVWCNFLRNHNLQKNAVVVEVGPGFAIKIGLGLAQMGFNGQLYVLEPAEQALASAISSYEKILPEARIVAVNQTLSNWDANIRQPVDALLMNHVLDDLILHAAAPSPLGRVIFDDMRSNQATCQHEVYTLWKEIMANAGWQDQLTATVIDSLVQLIGRIRPRLLGISQYESWFLNNNDLHEVNQYCREVLGRLAVQLGASTSIDNQMLSAHGQDAREWLLLEESTK